MAIARVCELGGPAIGSKLSPGANRGALLDLAVTAFPDRGFQHYR